MTSTNDGKDVKSNQTSGPKGKTFYIELYKSLEAGLSKDCGLSERTQNLCEAWRRVHSLCTHSTDSTHPHLLSWLQRHTARTVLQTKWQNPESKNEHKRLEEAIDAFIAESQSSPDGDPPWQNQLVARGEWFKRILANPWGHPVLRILLDPESGESPTDEDVLKWLKEERAVMFVTRIRQLASSKDCQDLALRLVSSILDRVRACMEPPKDDILDELKDPEVDKKPTFTDMLKSEAGFTVDVMDFLTDIEFVLLHKRDKLARCIELAKLTPLRNGYQLVERLRNRLDASPRAKKLWKNAKDVATLIAQVVITRCMVVGACVGAARMALYCCTRSLARLVPPPRLPAAAAALAAPAATARHLHTLADAVHAQSTADMRPFVCELYVRAITAGMNELERFKLNSDKESEARASEQMLSQWFIQLGGVLSSSERMRCECILTAFSVHPTPDMYGKISSAPELPPVALDNEPKQETIPSEFGSWASDSRSQTNFVKTSETLKLKHTQNQANVLSTAILNEGEALGLNPVLCQDIAVLLSGPRLKTLSWDMNRNLLLDNCRTYMEQTNFGTRALTTELKYLNLDLRQYEHLPEEEEDDNDIYYGIEKGYEHLVEFQPEEIWEDALYPEQAFSGHSTDVDTESILYKSKKKSKKIFTQTELEEDPLSTGAETKRVEKKKERPHSKERSKEHKPRTKTKLKDPLDITDNSTQKDDNIEQKKDQGVDKKKDGKIERKKHHSTERNKEAKDKDKKKEKKERKPKVKDGQGSLKATSLSSLVGMKITKIDDPKTSLSALTTDSDYDSQGKSSVNSIISEINETDVVFDGLYCMDELRSPEKRLDVVEMTKNNELSVANGNTRVSHDDTKKIERSLNYINSDTAKEKSRNVKDSITKLLQFRRQKELSKSYEKRSILIQPAQRVMSQPPLSYQSRPNINKYQSEPLVGLSDTNNLLNNKDCMIEPEIQNVYNRKLNNIFNNAIPTGTKVLNYDFSRTEQRPTISNDLKTSEKNTDTSCRTTPTSNPRTQNSEHQNKFNNFVKELQKSINAGTSHYCTPTTARKEIKPISKVSPVIPKSEPKLVQSAKQVKISEQAPNTFSRLNYYKSNLYTNDIIQYQKLQCQSMADLGRSILQYKNNKIKAMQDIGNSGTKKTGPNNANQAVMKIPINMAREHTTTDNTGSSGGHRASSSLSKAQNSHKNIPIGKPHDMTLLSNKQISLSDKNQLELSLLLRQQSRQNVTKPKGETVKGACPLQTSKNSMTSTYNTASSQDMRILDQKSVIVANKSSLIKPSSSLNPAKKPLGKSIIVKTELSHSKSLDQKYNEIQKVEVIDSEGSLKSVVDVKQQQSKQTDWETVMDAILKHKTPSRGPNALDMALRNDTYMSAFESLQNQNIQTPPDFSSKLIKPTIKENESEKDLVSSTVTDRIKRRPNVLRRSNTDINIKNLKQKAAKQVANTPSVINPAVEVKINPELNHQSDINNTSINHVNEVQTIPTKPQYSDSEISKQMISNNRAKSLASSSKKVATKDTFTCFPAKQDNQFSTGMLNSDYDLLEELMDDDLRQEIGELSSDEDTHKSNSLISYAQDTKGLVIKDIGDNKHAQQVNMSPALNSGLCKSILKITPQTIPINEPVKGNFSTILPIKQATASIENVSNHVDLSTGQNIPSINKVDNISPQMPTSVIMSPKKEQNLPNVPTYTALPQQAALQDIVLVGSELVYQPCVQTVQEGSSQTGFVAFKSQPNIAVYHTAQFTVPIVEPVNIGSAITEYSTGTNIPSTVNKTEVALPFSCEVVGNDLKNNSSCTKIVKSNLNINTSHDGTVSYEKNDTKPHKHSERKVLSEVQDKLSINENIDTECTKSPTKMNQFKLEVKTIAEQERLINKRKAILNRNIYHYSNNKPIALSYTPLHNNIPESGKSSDQHNLRNTGKISTSNIDSKPINVTEESRINKITTVVSDYEINNETSKENKQDGLGCRRILLRSSNKLKSDTVNSSIVDVAVDTVVDFHNTNLTVDTSKLQLNNKVAKNKKVIKKKQKLKRSLKKSTKTEQIEKRVTRQTSKNSCTVLSNNSTESEDKNETYTSSEDKSVMCNKPGFVITNELTELMDLEEKIEISMILKTVSSSEIPDAFVDNGIILENSASRIDDHKTFFLGKVDDNVIQDDRIPSSRLQSEKDYPCSPSIIESNSDVLSPLSVKTDTNSQNSKDPIISLSPTAVRSETDELSPSLVTKSPSPIQISVSSTAVQSETDGLSACLVRKSSSPIQMQSDCTLPIKTSINIPSQELIQMNSDAPSSNSSSKSLVEICEKNAIYFVQEECKLDPKNLENKDNIDKESTIAYKENIEKDSTFADKENIDKEFTIADKENINKESTIAYKESNIADKANIDKESTIAYKENIDKESTIAGKDNIDKESTIADKENIDKESTIAYKENIHKESNIAGKENIDKEVTIADKENIDKESTIADDNIALDLPPKNYRSRKSSNPITINKLPANKGRIGVATIKRKVKPAEDHDDVKNDEPEVICLDNDDELDFVSKHNAEAMPQSFLDAIKIEYLPNCDKDDPLKKFVRIILPNGRAFKATVRGQTHFDIDTLFSDPALRSVFINNLSNKNKYTLNIKQVSDINKCNIETRIQNISVHPSIPNKISSIETINLLSDDEESDDLRYFKTESGKYKVTSMKRKLHESHQKCFDKKCIVKLRRQTLPLPNVDVYQSSNLDTVPLKLNSSDLKTSEVELIIPDKFTEFTDSTAIPSLKQSVEKLIASLPQGLTVKRSTPTVREINNINDLDNDDRDNKERSGEAKDEKIQLFKNLLLKDLGIVDDITNKGTKPDLAVENITEYRRLTNMRPKCVAGLPISNGVNYGQPGLKLIPKSVTTDSIIASNCYVNLTKCDDLVKNYTNLKKCAVKLVRCDRNIPNKSKSPDDQIISDSSHSLLGHNTTYEDIISLSSVESISRSGSFSILNDYKIDDISTSKELNRCSSPVMEVYESIAALYYNKPEIDAHKYGQLSCKTQWFMTKSQLHLQFKHNIREYFNINKPNNKGSVNSTEVFETSAFLDTEIKLNADVCELLPYKFGVPDLVTIITKKLQDRYFMNRLHRVYFTMQYKNPLPSLKRKKTTNVQMAVKMSKMSKNVCIVQSCSMRSSEFQNKKSQEAVSKSEKHKELLSTETGNKLQENLSQKTSEKSEESLSDKTNNRNIELILTKTCEKMDTHDNENVIMTTRVTKIEDRLSAAPYRNENTSTNLIFPEEQNIHNSAITISGTVTESLDYQRNEKDELGNDNVETKMLEINKKFTSSPTYESLETDYDCILHKTIIYANSMQNDKTENTHLNFSEIESHVESDYNHIPERITDISNKRNTDIVTEVPLETQQTESETSTSITSTDVEPQGNILAFVKTNPTSKSSEDIFAEISSELEKIFNSENSYKNNCDTSQVKDKQIPVENDHRPDQMNINCEENPVNRDYQILRSGVDQQTYDSCELLSTALAGLSFSKTYDASCQDLANMNVSNNCSDICQEKLFVRDESLDDIRLRCSSVQNSCVDLIHVLDDNAPIMSANKNQSEVLSCDKTDATDIKSVNTKSHHAMIAETGNMNKKSISEDDQIELDLAQIVLGNNTIEYHDNKLFGVNTLSSNIISTPQQSLESNLLELYDDFMPAKPERVERDKSKSGSLIENGSGNMNIVEISVMSNSTLDDSADAHVDKFKLRCSQIVTGEDNKKDTCSHLSEVLDVSDQPFPNTFVKNQNNKKSESLNESDTGNQHEINTFSVTVSENGVLLNDIPSDDVEDIVEIRSDDELKREIARIVLGGSNGEDDDKQILIIDEDNLEYDELKICCIKQSELQKLITIDSRDGDTKLKDIKYVNSSLVPFDYSKQEIKEFSQSSDDDILQVTEALDEQGNIKKMEVILNKPPATYSRSFVKDCLNHNWLGDKKSKMRYLKRKCDMTDVRTPEKKYRKSKNIDTPKLTAAVLAANAYAKEFKYLLDYCSSVKFSYSRPFHKDDINVHNTLRCWPITGNCDIKNDAQIDANLFNDIIIPTTLHDPLQQTLATEIATKYTESDYSVSEVTETNFQMGFGEGSGRVIQNSEDSGCLNFSAATLSDVKQNRPLLLSENLDCFQDTRNEVEKMQRGYKCIQLKNKVRTFFKKNMIELNNELIKQSEKDNIFLTSTDYSNFPFGLNLTDFIEPLPVELCVQVVQVGQLPVSASAQNPMTCDPRVTQVSNASPSQCSAENSLNDDSQSPIKTEYIELTTADIRFPLQDYAQHHNQLSLVSQDTDRLLHTDVLVENIKEEIKQEIKEEPETNDEVNDDFTISRNESYYVNHNNLVDNVVYSYDANQPPTLAVSDANSEITQSTDKQITFQSFLNQQMQYSQQIQHAQPNYQVSQQQQNQSAQFPQHKHLTQDNQVQGQQLSPHLQQEQQIHNHQQQNQLTQENQVLDQHHSQQAHLPRQNQQSQLQQQQQLLRRNQAQAQSQNQQVQFPQQNQPSPVIKQNCQNEQNGILEKSDQIVHAMNAAGIATASENLTQARTHALVNIISQKLRQGAISCAPSTNSYAKTTQINAMALQQAFAQILPPPLSQTNATENNQQNTTSTSQVLHIVQGKDASGNQITLVDNGQTCNNNAPSTTPVLHIVQNKGNSSGSVPNSTPAPQANSFSGLSLVDTGLQQGNQLLHIVNTGNQKNANTGQLLRKVNLLTNLANVQGSNEQKMLQFVCKSADGKAIQLNASNQRGMVLRLQPIESPNLQQIPSKSAESQESNATSSTPNNLPIKESPQQEIKSRSVYEENYAKFIQSSNKTTATEKATSLPKFGQAFGKQVFEEGSQKNELHNSNSHLPSASENLDCQPNDNAVNLEHISHMTSPPLLLRKSAQTSQAQPNLVQQLKQSIAPMSMGMHGGVIYTRQIPVNIGGGQTINLITVPSPDLDDSGSKQQGVVNQEGIEQSIIKLVPQTTASNSENSEENNSHVGVSNDNSHTPQPVLTQMRIKLPMLSKNPQMVSGARLVRPSFFQIQRNVIGGANQQVYQQLVLTAAPPLGQQTIRLPQTQSTKQVKVPSESQSPPEPQMSSSTLEQLREFDLVLEQVKERSTGTTISQPNATSSSAVTSPVFSIQQTSSKDITDSSTPVCTAPTQKNQQVLYSVNSTPPLSVAYVNKKAPSTIPNLTPTSSFSSSRSPDSSEPVESPTSSTNQIARTVPTTASVSNPTTSSTVNNNSAGAQSKPPKPKPKPRPKAASNPPNTLKLPPAPPKTSTQKPAEDEQTTQRILYILAEYKEQVENSPDKNKPAPRRRTNLPSNPGCSSKRKKCSGSRRSGRDMSPCHGEDTCPTMGSEDSSCGTSQGDCNESCVDSHSPQDSPRKVVRKLMFENDTSIPIMHPRPQPQRNVIVADGQTITVARGTAGKPTTAVLMPANYILPVSMVKGGQQIAIVTNRGPKLLTVGGEGGTTNALLLQRLISPAGLKPVLTRPGVRHVRLPTAALHNLQALNLTTATAVHPPDTGPSTTTIPNPPDLVDTRASSSPWRTDSEPHNTKPERGSSPESPELWHLPLSDYCYEETVRAENLDRTVLVVHKKDGSHRQHRLTHVSAATLKHKYAILEHELRLQKSLSEECEDLGVDSPSASELFPEAELLFAASPAHDHTHDQVHHSHTPQPILTHSGIPQPDMDDQIATDQLLRPEHMHDDRDLGLGLEDVGIVTVSEDGMQATIQLDQEEFARSHPNTTFHSEPTEEGEIQQPFTLSGLKGRHITSAIFHANRPPGTVLMSGPQTTVISQATGDNIGVHHNSIKYSDIDNVINSLPETHNNSINLSSVLVKEDGLSRFDNLLHNSRELHLSNTASTIVHSSGHTTQVIRRVCYENDRRERDRYLMDESDGLIAGDDAKMMGEDSSRDATLESMGDTTSSPERHTEMFWESNSASGRADFSSDSEKCCKSPLDDTSTDSSAGVSISAHMRLDSVIKEARVMTSDDDVPPLRTYPAPRSLSGKTAPSSEDVTGKRRASGRGVVKRGTCLCCVSETAPPRPKKPRQRRPALDFAAAN